MPHNDEYVKELETFVRDFVANFEPCSACDGRGVEPHTRDDACHSCGGTGSQVKSRGVLLSELLHDGKRLLNKIEPSGNKYHAVLRRRNGDVVKFASGTDRRKVERIALSYAKAGDQVELYLEGDPDELLKRIVRG